MKALDLARVRGRGVWSVLRAVAGRPAGWGHLVLRLDAFDSPVPVPESTLDLDGWQALLVDRFASGGVVPTRVVARADHPLLPEVARFAARLDAPVTVRTGVAGMDGRVAEALAAGGVRRVVLLGWSAEAVGVLDGARRARGAVLDVVVEVPVGTDLDAGMAELRAAGADGVRVGLPWVGGPWDAETRAWITAAASRVASFHRSDPGALRLGLHMDGAGPGAPRTGGHCAVGGLRLEVGPDGGMCSCPFQPGSVPAGGDPEAGLADHRARIRACGRVCVHPELLGPTAR